MTSRFHLVVVLGTLGVVGCSDSFNAGPMKYVESSRLETELKEKPKLRDKLRAALLALFGDDPQNIRVPAGTGLPLGGARLANRVRQSDDRIVRIKLPVTTDPAQPPVPELVRGGYGLYREHCLHCHGVSGAGDGPTAPFLFPRPRDYRKGIFKFTSTAGGQKPTRKDLEKTILHGLHGTSMPAFEALMTDFEIDQVIDYVIFLSMRGEVENQLVEEALIADDADPDALNEEAQTGIARAVFQKWKDADAQVLNPPVPRVASTTESVHRGRDLFLQRDKAAHKLECSGCHGPQAMGDGPSFVPQEVFYDVVFGGNPSTRPERLNVWFEKNPKLKELWNKGSLDDWGDPLRPANLNRGVYKGGRRPIDIYWRIAKGINGAKMPGHASTLKPEEIWDIVNFVLALPTEPDLLKGARLPAASPAAASSVAGR